MVSTLPYLTDISLLALILLAGVLVSVFSLRFKLPDILLLIILGIFFSNFFSFPLSFLASLSIFALVMIIFDSTSRFKLEEVNKLFPYSIKLVALFFIFNLIFLTFFTHFLFSWEFTIQAFLISALFAALMSGTDSSSVLSLLSVKKHRTNEILEFESIINTPITLLVPLIIIDFYQGVLETNIVLQTFAQNIMTGIGTGLVLGLIVFRLMKKNYIWNLSSLVLIAVALIAYSLAEFIGGSGVLAVTTLGMVFAVSVIREKVELEKFSGIFTNFLRIIAFILVGLIIKEPLAKAGFDALFIIKSILLFIVYIMIRYLAVRIASYHLNLSSKEKWYMALNVSKGMSVAIIIFILSKIEIPGLVTVLTLSFLFMIYSIVVASITTRFAGHFLGKNVELKQLKHPKVETPMPKRKLKKKT